MASDRIGQQTRRGLSWNLAGALITNGTRLVVLVVLGRVLTQNDFGIVAAAVSVNTIVYSIRDIGIGPALIQRRELDTGHLETAFALTMYLGIAISALLFFGAPVIGDLFNITESVDVIRALALLFLLRNVAATSRVVLRRAMNFRLIAIVDAVSFAIGSGVSIGSAILGAGPWALVAGYLVEEVISTVLYLGYSPPKVAFRIDRTKLNELLGFGIAQTVTQIANTIAMYGDNVVVGQFLGTRALGYYSRAYDLIRFPAIVFDAIVGNVLFPAFSRIQDDKKNLAAGFRRGTFVNSLLLFPASAALMVLAPEAIRILIGSGWDEAVLPFQILAITIVMRTNQKLGALVAQAAGAVNAVAIAVVIYMILVVAGAAVSVHWGIGGVAATTALAICIVSIECVYLAVRVSGLSLGDVLRAYVPGLVLACLVIAIGWPAANALRATDLAAWMIFAVVTAGVVAACIIVLAMWLRRGRGDFGWLAYELRQLRRRPKG